MKTRIEEIPSELQKKGLTVDLEFDIDDRGIERSHYSNEDYQITIGDCIVSCGLLVEEFGRNVSGTHYQPPEYDCISRDVEVWGVEVFDLTEDEEVELTEVQEKRICETIELMLL